MQPRTSEEKKNILDKSGASSDELEEYEKLISKRFRRDPSEVDPDLARIKYLEDKLFGHLDWSLVSVQGNGSAIEFASIKKEMEAKGDFSVEQASEEICKILKEIKCKN